VISVRHLIVSAPFAVGVRGIAGGDLGVALGVRLIDCDHVLVHVILVRVMEMAVMHVVDVIVVAHRGVATAGSVPVRMFVFVDLVAHAPTLGRCARFRKQTRTWRGYTRPVSRGCSSVG
jgi:hypothetical protein